MKILLRLLLLIVIGLTMSACFAEKTYIGKVDVVGVSVGKKPISNDANSINKSQLTNILVTYADKIEIEEQDISKSTKYIGGGAITRKFSGEPKFLVDYLNVYQNLNNKVVILDKNGVVAWSGKFSNADVTQANGVYDYGLTGIDRMNFGQAMEKFVLDEDEAEDYDADKKIVFSKDGGSLFSNSGKFPLLFTKLPDMKVTNEEGQEISLSTIMKNGKPTVLVFNMSKASGKSLTNDVKSAIGMVTRFAGSNTSSTTATPQKVLQNIEEIYFVK